MGSPDFPDLKRAYEILSKEGPYSLFTSSFDYITSGFLFDILYYRDRIVNDVELYNDVAEESYYYTQNEDVNIDGSSCHRRLPEQVQSWLGTYTTPRLFVSKINGAKLHKSGTVFTEDGDIIYNSLGNCEHLYKHWLQSEGSRFSYLQGILSGKPLMSSVSGASSTIPKGFNLVRSASFYHWITENLPNIRALECYEKKTGDQVPIITEKEPPEWVIEYLSLLDLEDRIIPLSDETVAVKTLITAPRRIRIGACFNPSTNNLEWVRQRFISAVSSNPRKSDEMIYISRSDADSRQITNEDELIDELSDYGFKKYILSNYSVSEQIKLFANADFVVAPHGAGLTNAIFANDISMLEIIPNKWHWHDFYCMSNQLGFKYDYYRTDTKDEKDDNIYVNTEEVIDQVEKLLN